MKSCPEFHLVDVDGSRILNTSFEYDEQKLLCTHVRDGDVVLQLGGNIGTSCVMTDKLGASTYCVEPQEAVLETLRKNCRDTNIKIMQGIIDEEYSSAGLVGSGLGAHTTEAGNITVHRLSQVIAPSDINVLFMDCEGCAPRFLNQHPLETMPALRVVIYERDRLPETEYDLMERDMERSGWMCTGEFHRVCLKS